MTLHPNDTSLLQRLIALTIAITSKPYTSPDFTRAVCEVADDIAVAIRCPAPGRHVGTIEAALVLLLKRLAAERVATIAEVLMLCNTAQGLLPLVREHLSEAVLMGASRA
jgi:hypothetical protein